MVIEFKSLSEMMEAFAEPQSAIDYFTAIRWRHGRFCPYCGGDKVYNLHTEKNRYMCADPECHQKFSITVGTIFENTKLPLKIWFGAMWLITNHKKGIASTTLARDLNITQKSAWFMLHRIRHAAKMKSFNKPLTGVVEVDETFVGGKAKNRHKKDRDGNPGPTASGKTIVAGAMQRDGKVAAKVVSVPPIAAPASEEASNQSSRPPCHQSSTERQSDAGPHSGACPLSEQTLQVTRRHLLLDACLRQSRADTMEAFG